MASNQQAGGLHYHGAIASVVLLLLCQLASAQDTTGTVVLGYQYVSNVDSYIKFIADVCTLKAALDPTPPDYTTARGYYINGITTTKSLKGFANNSFPTYLAEPYAGMYATYFGGNTFLHTYIESAFNRTDPKPAPFNLDKQARQHLLKTMQYGVIVSYIFHELDAALTKIRASNLNVTTGAPHNVDEAAAMYLGATGSSTSCTIFAHAESRSKEFATRYDCAISKVNWETLKALNGSLAAAKTGNEAGYVSAVQSFERQIVIQFSQGVLKYAKRLQVNLQSSTPNQDDLLEHQAEAYAFWRVIAPLVNRTRSASASTVESLLNPFTVLPVTATNIYDQIKAVLDAAFALYPGGAIMAAEVGTYEATINIPACSAPPPPKNAAPALGMGLSLIMVLAAMTMTYLTTAIF